MKNFSVIKKEPGNIHWQISFLVTIFNIRVALNPCFVATRVYQYQLVHNKFTNQKKLRCNHDFDVKDMSHVIECYFSRIVPCCWNLVDDAKLGWLQLENQERKQLKSVKMKMQICTSMCCFQERRRRCFALLAIFQYCCLCLTISSD